MPIAPPILSAGRSHKRQGETGTSLSAKQAVEELLPGWILSDLSDNISWLKYNLPQTVIISELASSAQCF